MIGHLYCVEEFLDLPKDTVRNVYFDLSNFYFVSKERFLRGYEALGAEHFMLGSDTPYGKDAPEGTARLIGESGIPERDAADICGENATRLYGLS